jgi:hypothetical protein
MTPDEILEVDAKRNHPPGTVAGNLRAVINDNTRRHGGVLQQGNTLVMFRISAPKIMEFHCFNADTPQNLVKNLKVILRVFKKLGVKMAHTPYENPKINDLVKQLSPEFKVAIKQIPGGFSAEVRL